MNDWFPPYMTKDSVQMTWGRSCWNCKHIRVSSFPQRKCSINKTDHIWSSDPENERMEMGKVVAEECNYYLPMQLYVRKQQQIGSF